MAHRNKEYLVVQNNLFKYRTICKPNNIEYYFREI